MTEKKKLRHTFATQIRMLSARLEKAEAELSETKAALRDERQETRRLKRILRSTDVGTMLELRAKLQEAEARVRYLTNEILAD